MAKRGIRSKIADLVVVEAISPVQDPLIITARGAISSRAWNQAVRASRVNDWPPVVVQIKEYMGHGQSKVAAEG